MKYTCVICKKEFKSTYKYERHLNAQNSCDPEIKQSKLKQNVTCKYCQSIFYDTSTKNRHEKKCNSQQIVENNYDNSKKLENIIAKLTETVNKQNKKIDKQSSQMEQLIKKEEKSIVVNNVKNVTNQTQNIIALNAFGKENLDFITDKQYNKIFGKGCRALQHFVELVHCNPNAPENRNIYIGNFKDEYIRIYNGKSWDVETKEDVLYNLYHTKRDFLESKYEEMKGIKGKLTDDAKYFFGKMYFENGKTPEAIKMIKNDMKSILYDNRLHVEKPTKHKKHNKINKINKIQMENINNNSNDSDECDDNPYQYDPKNPNNYVPEVSMF